MTVIAVDITDQAVAFPTSPLSAHDPAWIRVRPNIRRTHTPRFAWGAYPPPATMPATLPC